MTRIGISYFADDSVYPNAGPLAARRRIYWENIAVACLTASANSVGASVCVYTNDTPPADVQFILGESNVSRIEVPFKHRFQSSPNARFVGALYLLDALSDLRNSDDEIILVIDPDCFTSRSLYPLFEHIRDRGHFLYSPNYSPVQMVNGCSRQLIWEFLQKHFSYDGPVPEYVGGEIVGMRRDSLGKLVGAIDFIFAANMKSGSMTAPVLQTEEHILTAAAAITSMTPTAAGPFIKRMWTRSAFYNVTPDDQDRIIWHLPAEKTHRLRRMYRYLANRGDQKYDVLRLDVKAQAAIVGARYDWRMDLLATLRARPLARVFEGMLREAFRARASGV